MTVEADSTLENIAPGSLVVVRDEEWLVTQVSHNSDGLLVTVEGLSELVAGTSAQFSSGLDEITVADPSMTKVVPDDSPGYRRARLWLEATLRKMPLPIGDPNLSVSDGMLMNTLEYQRSAVRKALDPNILRPRILLADAVGLGKTLEIGMLLAELVRRGRGERILIVTPRHVLEQMQQEMWTRFALPFVRLDSLGIQQVRRRLPASRNPFSVYKRAIISIDTLKNDRYLAHLRKHRWDAVVIDESHNITGSKTQNNRLATVLAPQTDALILASATPHNGKASSFAELMRLLEPTSVAPDGEIDQKDIERLVVRRHRHSTEVAEVVGGEWAERLEPVNRLVPASVEEDEIAEELADNWLYDSTGRRGGDALFGWTLAKAFLSSPAALAETCSNRLKRAEGLNVTEHDSLIHLRELAERAESTKTGKYAALLEELDRIGIAPDSRARVVIFAERVATLKWLRERVMKDLNLAADQVRVMHGGLSDVEQQEIVDEFKQEGTRLRVLVTGDVASEGVNLHRQCHELIHFDIPWSLIRIEQRNGRIDRYGRSSLRRSRPCCCRPATTASPVTCGCCVRWSRRSTKPTRRSATRPRSWVSTTWQPRRSRSWPSCVGGSSWTRCSRLRRMS
ncbi:helicase-related protein [Flexivirga oryzae]|uniref:SNF2 family DNA or RNA helicase n=1 Tax=Flexivirga oryzae TaxID=1794944 RepID=A0A839N4V5_9MICO|nr:helicase-related protein [Flexivirga oryzae]MBB2890656.1 SNF2 family DNA or RNA helicase [Flexivirga oryzae]